MFGYTKWEKGRNGDFGFILKSTLDHFAYLQSLDQPLNVHVFQTSEDPLIVLLI